ncbi:MAG: hypothetical protein Q7W51_02585 [Coriobacteriia bacterium]|nr:hypothetical protein [Coriobacteriia bacterium]
MRVDVWGTVADSLDSYLGLDVLSATLPHAVLQVEESTSLAQIVAEVEVELGLADQQYSGLTITFGHELHERYGSMVPDSHGDYLTVLDDRGAVRWWVPRGEWDSITYRNLVDSHLAGLVDDPSEIRLVKSHQYGNGIPPMEWARFFEVLGYILSARELGKLALAGAKAIKAHFDDWRDRRAKPEDIFHFILDRRSWDRDDLAKRLSLSTDESEGVLELFGYSFDEESELFVRDEDGRTMRFRNELKDAFERYEDD